MTSIIRGLRTDTDMTRVDNLNFDNIVVNQFGHLKIDGISTITSTINDNNVNINIKKINDLAIAINSGDNSNSTQRVCIADNDTNLSDIRNKITIIYNILNDVYDQNLRTLRVSNI